MGIRIRIKRKIKIKQGVNMRLIYIRSVLQKATIRAPVRLTIRCMRFKVLYILIISREYTVRCKISIILVYQNPYSPPLWRKAIRFAYSSSPRFLLVLYSNCSERMCLRARIFQLLGTIKLKLSLNTLASYERRSVREHQN